MQIKLLFIQEYPKLFFQIAPKKLKRLLPFFFLFIFNLKIASISFKILKTPPFAPLLFIVPQLTKITPTLGNPDLKYNLLKLLLASDELLLQGNGVTQHKLSNKLV